MNEISTEPKGTSAEVAAPVAQQTLSQEEGNRCCWRGVVALVAGLFVCGIPLSIYAIIQGNLGIKHGAVGFGTGVKAVGWIALVLYVLAILVIMANHAQRP